jgi:hypothetical protein
MMNISDYAVWLLPIVIGIVQAIKQTPLPNKYLPLVSIIVSEIICFFFMRNLDISQVSLLGVQMGLAAVGLYEGVNNFMPKEVFTPPAPAAEIKEPAAIKLEELPIIEVKKEEAPAAPSETPTPGTEDKTAK